MTHTVVNRQVRFDAYGDEDVLHLVDTDVPVPGPGEVVVRVMAAGINPGEAMIRSGRLAATLPANFPSGQGSDFAGFVHAVGPGTAAVAVGDEVLGWTDHRASHADFVLAHVDQVTAKPFPLDFVRAGSLFVAGTTAWAAVRAVDVRAGDTVVVAGATGGVGSIAVQLARIAGARVLGVASSRNAGWLRSVGVEPVERGAGLAERLHAVAPRIDAVVDTHGGGYVDLAVELGVAFDRIDTVIDFEAAARVGAHHDANAEGSDVRVLGRLAHLVAWGDVTVPVAAVHPLGDVRQAFRELGAGRTLGKIALAPGLAQTARHPGRDDS